MLNEKLDAYLKEEIYPFHMPGHKRNKCLRSDIPYARDITEIPGFDNLNDPQEIFKDLEEKIAGIYEVVDAIVSVNGTTAGLLASIRALTYHNKNILIQRSCHKAVYNAIELNNLSADYIPVVLDDISAIVDINMEVFINQIKAKDYAAVVVTSPSYEGYHLNLDEIYKLCQENKIPLILDMAHGSAGVLDKTYNKNFDIAITSFHKNLPTLTSAAAVLINNEKYAREVRRNMSIFQTSSPSYIILASIDEMVENFNKLYNLQDNLDQELNELYSLRLEKLDLINKKNKDRSKILISTARANISGETLAKMLRTEKIEVEMAYPSYALLLSTVYDTTEGFELLKKALVKIDSKLKAREKTQDFYYVIPKKKLEIGRAATSPKIDIKLADALGKIAGQFVYAYPPGIPLLAPGEVIDQEVLNNIAFLKNNGTDVNVGTTIAVID